MLNNGIYTPGRAGGESKKTRMKSKTSHPSNENLKRELPFLWAVKAVQILGRRS
jgi:catalase (peroxidase I)